MGLSALLYLLCSSKASKIDFLELGFRNWGYAHLLVDLVMSLYSCWSSSRYAVSVKSIRRIGSWLGVGTTFDIFKPSRIFFQIINTAYRESWYGVLQIFPLGCAWISIRRIVMDDTPYGTLCRRGIDGFQVLDTPYPSREYDVLVWLEARMINTSDFFR